MRAPDDPATTLTVFHNPRCSKSREALAIVAAGGVPHVVVEYLKDPPDRATLEAVAAGLDAPPVELVRTGDEAFRALGVDPVTLSTPSAVVDLLVAHPEVMQRPLVVRGGRAVIARPPERVAELLGG